MYFTTFFWACMVIIQFSKKELSECQGGRLQICPVLVIYSGMYGDT